MTASERLAEANREIERCGREIERYQRARIMAADERARTIANIENELRQWQKQRDVAVAELQPDLFGEAG